ncbi:hydantoinase [Amylibacter kogurei]|uniref:Hydantoinase n=1 Tax=Paramylibacter kogurei TaxID=1889778 RepID=A0A2G5K3G6_9RHOB|nr:hydantoinase/oxoprolinase family protein [Amylibacter kogurei]PIB24051.1 hydantoinase [Amylibacter kogurei]
MALMLGVDTGGTYTDAVLIRDEETVIASAKSLTTRHDLSVGISRAIASVLEQSGADKSQIAMASMSTTLATNALVEGQGGRVGLILIGFSEKDVARQGLAQALNGDPVIYVAGGHNHSGGEIAPLDVAHLRDELAKVADDLSGIAIASQFATRNPAHEIAAREIVRETSALPVSCSHELSAKLGGPKRAMTAVLNARLIGMIDHLIAATEGLLNDLDIDAPLMVVRGDGALISADQAREKPIETILSGPAASIVGARWLTDASDALVSDIGGTTTDIALLRDGRPMIDPDGASVGGLRTMVEAVAMRTTGLGGDSEVHIDKDGLAGGLQLGPRRVMPISLLAMDWSDLVHTTLDRQLNENRVGEFAARFIVPIQGNSLSRAGLEPRQVRLLDRVGDTPKPLGDVLQTRVELGVLDRLISRGHVIVSAITPSDASHVLGRLDAWDQEAAQKALTLFAGQRTGAGVRVANDASTLAQKIIDQLTEQTCEALLEAAFAEEPDINGTPRELARHVLMKSGLNNHRNVVAIKADLNLPIIGLGASARAYYGAVGDRLHTTTILPEHGGVANAIGAVVGQITMREMGEVNSAGEGRYQAFLDHGPQMFDDQSKAIATLEQELKTRAQSAAVAAGAQDVRIQVSQDIQTADVENRQVFVSAQITVTASGRPRIAIE